LITQERKKARELARVTNRKLQEYNNMKYDQRHKKNTLYKEGDLVLIKVLQHKPGTNVKLAPKYKGPYRVKAVKQETVCNHGYSGIQFNTETFKYNLVCGQIKILD